MILLDTTPLVALCDPHDALHAMARRDLRRLARQAMITCVPVLTEAAALLPYAAQRHRLREFLDEFAVVPYRLDHERALWSEVFDWLDRYQEHEPDWADGYLVALSGREKRARIWTYDREFREIWRRPDGTRIPLAVSLTSA